MPIIGGDGLYAPVAFPLDCFVGRYLALLVGLGLGWLCQISASGRRLILMPDEHCILQPVNMRYVLILDYF